MIRTESMGIENKNGMSMYALITGMVSDYASERGLTVTFADTDYLGITVYCEEAKGLWLNSLGMVCEDGCIGTFEVGYQHMDSQLMTVKSRVHEVLDLLTTYQNIEYNERLNTQLNQACAIFGV